MRRLIIPFLLLHLLCGCKPSEDAMNVAFRVREKLLQGNGCTFDAVVTADYPDAVYVFKMQCHMTTDGGVAFEVMSPEPICGIKGNISEVTGQLEFEDVVIGFPLIADGQLSPVCAPWIMIKALRGGYIHSGAKEDVGYHLIVDDSYSEDPMQLDIILNEQELLQSCQILWRGKQYLSIQIENFLYL